MKSSTKGKAQRKAAAASPEPKRSAHATHSGRHVDLGCPGGGARVATFITAIETCSCSWMLCMADTTWGAQGSGVLATQAVETRGKRRCLSHAGGGNTRQRRRLTVTWTPGRAMASTACVIACLSSENLCPARSKDPNVGRVSYQASKKPRDAENLDDKLARFRTVSRTVRKS